MSVLPLGDAKDRLSALVADVDSTHERVTITKHGHAAAVLVSPEDLDALEETLDTLSNRTVMEQIETTRTEIARGEAVGAEELTAAMEERRQRERSG